jgi:hypothetical protein
VKLIVPVSKIGLSRTGMEIGEVCLISQFAYQTARSGRSHRCLEPRGGQRNRFKCNVFSMLQISIVYLANLITQNFNK